MVQKGAYLTKEGLNKLEAELERLRSAGRQEVAQRIQSAAGIGGTVDNAEYDEAKNEQAFVEGRILTLENLINNAIVVGDDVAPSDIVRVGSRVAVINAAGDEEVYVIVGSSEADPLQGRISNESPVGRALLGKRVGDVTEATTPAGVVTLTISSTQ